MLTQTQIAKHLDISQKTVSILLNDKLGIDHRITGLDEIRVAYIRHLREQAAGRAGDDQYGLTRARTRESELTGDLKSVELAIKLGELVPAADFEEALSGPLEAVRNELLSLRERLIAIVEAETGARINEDLVDEAVKAAFTNLAAHEDDAAEGDEEKLEDIPTAG